MVILKPSKIQSKYKGNTMDTPPFGSLRQREWRPVDKGAAITHEVVEQAVARYFAAGGKMLVLPEQVVVRNLWVRVGNAKYNSTAAVVADIMYEGLL